MVFDNLWWTRRENNALKPEGKRNYLSRYKADGKEDSYERWCLWISRKAQQYSQEVLGEFSETKKTPSICWKLSLNSLELVNTVDSEHPVHFWKKFRTWSLRVSTVSVISVDHLESIEFYIFPVDIKDEGIILL